ncbi:MAG: archaetidylserine decarboxylase [Candidatus Babeliales bacterium]
MNILKLIIIFLLLPLAIWASPQKEASEQLNQFLPFLYTTTIGSAIRSVIIKPWFSNVAGWYADSRLSKIHIPSFIKKYSINMHETVKPNYKKYNSFNDFFTRKLNPKARPINSEQNSIVSPADGQIYIVQNIQQKTKFPVKGKQFDLIAFLKNKELAQQFYGGTLAVIYLAPWDYHRFHFPFNAIPSHAQSITGKFESVSPFVFSFLQPLQENERQLIMLKTTNNKDIAFVAVGALCVGRITQTYTPFKQYKKGEEAGYFSFGGSTVVLLFPPSTIKINDAIPLQTFAPIKMGKKIGSMID